MTKNTVLSTIESRWREFKDHCGPLTGDDREEIEALEKAIFFAGANAAIGVMARVPVAGEPTETAHLFRHRIDCLVSEMSDFTKSLSRLESD